VSSERNISENISGIDQTHVVYNGTGTCGSPGVGGITMAKRTTGDGDSLSAGSPGTVVSRTTQDDRSLSMTVVECLAEATGVSPVDIERPLYDVVDPDALDRLFTAETEGVGGRVVFELDGHEVTVRDDGSVVVRRLEE